MVSEGDIVRCYTVPNRVYEVAETGVSADRSVDGESGIRLDGGNTLLWDANRDGRYLIAPDELLHLIDP